MTKAELNAALEPLMSQVRQLDISIPLAKYAPATVATQTAIRDELTREAVIILDEWFGISPEQRAALKAGFTDE
jgi:hypothetical protein